MARESLLCCALAPLAIGAAASAIPVVSMTYDDLAASYTSTTATTGMLTARAVDMANLRSSGDVSRLINPPGTAAFQAGFVSGADLSDFVLNMMVTHNGLSGTGIGYFTATDADGDEITGEISGFFAQANGFIGFVGSLTSVLFNDLGSLDGTFNGSAGGSWGMNVGPSPFDGAMVHLVAGDNQFFTQNFTNRAMGLTAQVVAIPLPNAAAMSLAACAGLAAIRRRR